MSNLASVFLYHAPPPAAISPCSRASAQRRVGLSPRETSYSRVELFLSILQRPCQRPGSFRSPAELRTAVVAFLAAWNATRAHPFRWTFTGYPLQAGGDRPAAEAA